MTNTLNELSTQIIIETKNRVENIRRSLVTKFQHAQDVELVVDQALLFSAAHLIIANPDNEMTEDRMRLVFGDIITTIFEARKQAEAEAETEAGAGAEAELTIDVPANEEHF